MKRLISIAGAVIGMVCGGAAGDVDWVTQSDHGAGFWDVEFPGGSLTDYYEGLGEVFDDVNIVVHPIASKVAMPAVELDTMFSNALVMLPAELLSGINVGESVGSFTETPDGARQPMLWIVKVDQNQVTSWVPSDNLNRNEAQEWYDISFTGGTVEQYVAAIRDAVGGELNAVMMPGVEGVMVPEVSLRGVWASDAMKVLNELRRPDGEPWANVSQLSRRVYVLRPGSDEGREITREVWNLSELLASGIGEDGILRAVEMGLGSVGDGAEVLYHEDTGLLLVVGTHDHVHVVDEVLSEMHETAAVREHARMRAEERTREREELELEIQRFAAEIDVLQQRLVMQTETVQEFQKLVDEGMMSGHDVREAKIELREYQAELEIRVREMQMLERRLDVVRDTPDGGDGVGA